MSGVVMHSTAAWRRYELGAKTADASRFDVAGRGPQMKLLRHLKEPVSVSSFLLFEMCVPG